MKVEFKRKIGKLIAAYCFIFVLCNLAHLNNASAREVKEPIVVNGDRVEYLYEEKKIVGINNVVITYKDLNLTCDKIVVYMDTKDAIAEGNVVMVQGENVFRGDKIHYNFEKKKGTIIEAEVRVKPWYGKGKQAAKVNDDEYIIEKGYISTCDLPKPHYRVAAQRIKFFIDDRIEAYNIVVFIGKVPVFYFPAYVHLLRDNRPRVTIVPGRNSTWGYYALTAWRYYLHEWARGYIHVDWREKKGLGTGLDYKYRMGYFGKGLARFYYTHEDHTRTLEEAASRQDAGDDRWRTQVRHKWKIDTDTTAIGEFNKMSDKLFIKDYYYAEEFAENQQPETFLSVIRTKTYYNLNINVRKQMHDFFTVVERLPELEVNVRSQRLKNTDFYYQSTTAFVMLQKKFDKSLYQENLKANRINTGHELSYISKIFGFLTFNPYVGIQETWYSEDRRGRKNELRNVYTLGTKLSTKFYKIYDIQTDAFGLDINKIKHSITPMLNYKYVSTPNIKEDDLKRFDAIDGLTSNHGIDIEVVNRLQTKRDDSDEPVTIARILTRSGILFKPKTLVAEVRESDMVISHFFDDFYIDLELYPYPWLIVDSNATYSNESSRVKFANVDVVVHDDGDDDRWDLGLGVRYEDNPYSGSNAQITADGSYKISPKWRINAYHRFRKDINDNGFDLEEISYGFERQLHCWIAELNYQIKRTDGLEVDEEHRIWLVMRLKAFPDLPIRLFSAKYSAPTAGVGTSRSY